MKRLWLLLLIILATHLAAGQVAINGSITTAGTDCSTITNCVVLQLPTSAGGVTISLSGTWSATVRFEGCDAAGNCAALNGLPSNSTTAVTSATANGLWQFNTAGLPLIRARASALASGTVAVSIQSSQASARSNGGGGGAGSGCIPGGTSGDLQTNNGGGGCAAAAMNDNSTTVTTTETLTPLVAANENLGTALLPFGDLFLGGSASKSADFNTSALTANRTVAIPDHASNTIQGIANPSDANVINYVDTAGVQHRIAQTGSGGNANYTGSANQLPMGNGVAHTLVDSNPAITTDGTSWTINAPIIAGVGTFGSGGGTFLQQAFSTCTDAASTGFGVLCMDSVTGKLLVSYNQGGFSQLGGGNVNNSGTPLIHQLGVWTDATHIKGITVLGADTYLAGIGSADPQAGQFVACGDSTHTCQYTTGSPGTWSNVAISGSGNSQTALAGGCYTVATLPAGQAAGTIACVSDGAASTDCTAGSGSIKVTCQYTGSVWIPLTSLSAVGPATANTSTVNHATNALVVWDWASNTLIQQSFSMNCSNSTATNGYCLHLQATGQFWPLELQHTLSGAQHSQTLLVGPNWNTSAAVTEGALRIAAVDPNQTAGSLLLNALDGTTAGTLATKFSADNTGALFSAALAGSGARCLHTDASGNITATSSDCGSGGGGINYQGSEVSNAIATGYDSSHIQTVANAPTVDPTSGDVTMPSDGTHSAELLLQSKSSACNTIPGTGILGLCPGTSTTAYRIKFPTAAGDGIVYGNNSVGIDQLSFSGALTGIVRGGSPPTATELSGDCKTSGSNVTTCKFLMFGQSSQGSAGAGGTYYWGIHAIGLQSTAANVVSFVVPRAATLIAVQYCLAITGTLDSAAENQTMEVGTGGNGAAYSSALSDTILTLPSNAAAGCTAITTVNDAVTANQALIVKLSPPASYTVTPTNLSFSVRLTFQ